MWGGGLPIGSLFGIPLRVHWTFLLVLAVWAQAAFNPMVLICIMALFGTILLHELGHCFAARSVGGGAHGILLWPLGGLAFITGGTTPARSIYIALAGPLMHVPLALLCAGPLLNAGYPLGWEDLNPLHGPGPFPTNPEELLFFVFRMQVLLFCFNVCTPAYPMDGGQVLAGLMALVFPPWLTVTLLGCTTLATSLFLLTLGFSWVALWLGYEAIGLFTAVLTGGVEWHPVGRLYWGVMQTISLTPAIYVAPDTELIPCPNCGERLHPRSEKCVHCNHTLPY